MSGVRVRLIRQAQGFTLRREVDADALPEGLRTWLLDALGAGVFACDERATTGADAERYALELHSPDGDERFAFDETQVGPDALDLLDALWAEASESTRRGAV